MSQAFDDHFIRQRLAFKFEERCKALNIVFRPEIKQLLSDSGPSVSKDSSSSTRRSLHGDIHFFLNGSSKPLFNQRLSSLEVDALAYSFSTLFSTMKDSVLFTLSIDLSNNNLSQKDVENFLNVAVKNNKSIVSIELGGNNIGPSGCAQLVELLVPTEDHDDGANLEASTHKAAPPRGLHRIQLNNNPLNEGTLQIAKCLINNNTLFELELVNVGMCLDAIIALCTSLQRNTTLYSLNISNPDLSPPLALSNAHMNHLGRMLKTNRALQYVNLSKHRINSDGLGLLLDGMLGPSDAPPAALTHIDISCNSICPSSADTLARLISDRNRFQIKVLEMAHNSLGVGAHVLARAVRAGSCPQLQVLDLAANDMHDRALDDLLGALLGGNDECQAHPLQELRVWGNRFGPLACARLELLLAAKGASFLCDCHTYRVDGVIYVAKK